MNNFKQTIFNLFVVFDQPTQVCAGTVEDSDSDNDDKSHATEEFVEDSYLGNTLLFAAETQV